MEAHNGSCSSSDDCIDYHSNDVCTCDEDLKMYAMPPPSYRAGGWCKLHGDFVIIKPRTSSAQSTVHGSNEKIPKEEAICRFCNDTFKEENVVMLTCKCNKNTLAHESCSDQNNKNCDGCEQDLQKLLVTLHLEPYSTHSRKHENKKGSLASRLLRYFIQLLEFFPFQI
ncbi:hypothetical protein LguiA_029897 [Lonicera macranthoides]